MFMTKKIKHIFMSKNIKFAIIFMFRNIKGSKCMVMKY